MSAWISSAAACHFVGEARTLARMRARRAPRSAATQHITFDEVKCFGSPRTSQMPRSGSRQCSSAPSTCRRPSATCGRRVGRATSVWMYTESSTAPQTSCWRWSYAPLPMRTGRAPSYPREVVEDVLVELALAADAVHDLQVAVALGDVGDEGEEVVRLPVEAERVQRPQRERRVADPRVAVVPVALAAGGLRQRRRGRRDNAPVGANVSPLRVSALRSR